VSVDGKKEHHKTPKRDQFAPELIHFSECILENKKPNPCGYEGLNDLLVIEALRKSVETGTTIKVEKSKPSDKPNAELIIEKPGVSKPPLVKVQAPLK